MSAAHFMHELQHEAISTRKMLARLPNDKMGWKPHDKSMTLGELAVHVAELPTFISLILKTDALDFQSGDFVPSKADTAEELVRIFDNCTANAIADLDAVTDQDVLTRNWTASSGDHLIFTLPRAAALRTLAFSHLIHHRGQLAVYLRLLNIPVPSIYGPSADESEK